MKKTIRNKQHGFTLIEMLVVIGIMVLFISMAIPFETAYKTKVPIKNAAKQLRSLFWEAQARSLAPMKKEDTSYRIDLDKVIRTISLQECTTSCAAITGAQTPQVVLGSNVVIKLIVMFDSGGNVIGSYPYTSSISTSFLVGNSRDAGKISFSNVVPASANPIAKIKIYVGSTITTTQYYIIIDSQTNSIIYSTQ